MKPILVDGCNHFDHGKSTCTKCGRSLPDVCLEFEQMKQKAEAYEKLDGQGSLKKDDEASLPHRSDDGETVVAVEAQEPKKPRGRPRKVVNEKNAAD